MLKKIQKYFGFTIQESRGFLVLLVLLLILLLAPFGFRWYSFSTAKPLEISIDSIHYQSFTEDIKEREETTKTELFSFDPNQISQEEFIKLGCPLWLAHRIINYRTLGGKFKTKQELKKIYDFPEKLYATLENYILLPDIFEKKEAAPSQIKITLVDINQADTTVFKSLRGIGSKLSARIIKYRDFLGGFYDINQLKEVYGLDSMVVNESKKFLRINPNFSVRKIKINEVSFIKHPYCKPYQSKELQKYKTKIGKIENIETIKNLQLFDNQMLVKFSHYLEF